MMDTVEHPSHYTTGNMECITAIKGMLGRGFQDYCRGNVIKYLWRYQVKNGIEDVEKAEKYLEFMLDDLSDLDESYDKATPTYTYMFPKCLVSTHITDCVLKLNEEVSEVEGAMYSHLEDPSGKRRAHLIEEVMDVIAVSESCLRSLGVNNFEFEQAVSHVALKNTLRGYYG